VALEDLARALPLAQNFPRWAWGPHGSWAATRHRLLVPLFDPAGVLVTVRARTVLLGVEPKSLAPAGHAVRGAVMADHLGRTLLGGERPETWNGVVCVVEGEPDFLTWGINRSDGIESVPAVFGIEAGAWTEDIAARIPDGARVVVRTHHDTTGDCMAAVVGRTLAGRCEVLRSRSDGAA